MIFVVAKKGQRKKVKSENEAASISKARRAKQGSST